MWENHKLNNELIKSVNYFISVLTSSLLALGEVILKDVNFSSAFCNEKCKLDKVKALKFKFTQNLSQDHCLFYPIMLILWETLKKRHAAKMLLKNLSNCFYIYYIPQQCSFHINYLLTTLCGQ